MIDEVKEVVDFYLWASSEGVESKPLTAWLERARRASTAAPAVPKALMLAAEFHAGRAQDALDALDKLVTSVDILSNAPAPDERARAREMMSEAYTIAKAVLG